MKMSQPLRTDYPEGHGSFVTRRFRNSELLYKNNSPLEKRVLGSFGKYVHKFEAKVFALTLFGSHDHPFMEFKPGTKSSFFRDFGARTAEAVKKFVPGYGTGGVFESRPREQAVTPDHASHLDRLMYTIMQPILAGFCKNLSDYNGFNSFQYILSGKPLKVEFFRGSDYTRAKLRNKNANPKDYTEYYDIYFARIPGCEHMSQKEYRAYLLDAYEERRKRIIAEFDAKGHVWLDEVKPKPEKPKGSSSAKSVLEDDENETETPRDKAKNPKRSERYSKRPLVLSVCSLAREEFLNWYFTILTRYKKASRAYLDGDPLAPFPPGTIKPPGPYVAA